MAIFYAFGDAIVTEEELREKEVLGKMATFVQGLDEGREDASLEFSTGILKNNNIRKKIPRSEGRVVDYTPIGPGKPLTIEIRHVYTGKHPKKSWFDKTKDMMVTSAMKSIGPIDAVPRALNFLEDNVQSKHNTSLPAATDKGTPLIHYTPALTENNTVLTLEMGFDEFPDEIFSSVGSALTRAAGIPIFITVSKYLHGAGAITKLLGDIGSKVFDSTPVFKATEPLMFKRAGVEVPQADFRIITDDDVSEDVLKDYTIGKSGKLVKSNGNGEAYDGDTPYIVISLDGAENDEYKEFTATAASAALLERIYNLKEGQEQDLDLLLDAVKLYNDWKFRNKADELSAKLEDLDPGSDEYSKVKQLYKAATENILNDLLKPASE